MSQRWFATFVPWLLLLLLGAATVGGAFAAGWFDEGPIPSHTPAGTKISAPVPASSYIL